LQNKKALDYAIVLMPLAFMVIFTLRLFPDFVYHATNP